jgi:dTDP-4-dehydrorhamnose 3,5-epimerase
LAGSEISKLQSAESLNTLRNPFLDWCDILMGMEKFEEWDLTTNFDDRGFLRKIYMDSFQTNFHAGVKEVFLSESKRGTVRGMHLMFNEKANFRFVHVLAGTVFDLTVDLRKSSKTFLNIKENVLSSTEPKTLWIPPGVAHGFQALTDCQILYGSSSEWDSKFDVGFSPIGLNWPDPILHISERDLSLPKLEDFQNEGFN